jgi:hypothetical protein
MSKTIRGGIEKFHSSNRYSELTDVEREEGLKACRELTDSIYYGLDVTREICIVDSKQLGDTILLWGDGSLLGCTVCHCGENTEAGRDICYIKFGAVRAGIRAAEWLELLVQECSSFALQQGMSQLVCGVSLERSQSYRKMLLLGFRIDRLGVAIHKPNTPAYNYLDTFVLDDWR